jgi:putative tryptophan/tyrosine transport system substrate-binding protein
MDRRTFLGTLAGGLLAAPLAAGAQPAATPVIGYLSARSLDDAGDLVAAFRGGLSDAGFIEDKSVSIEYRWALGRYERLPALAAELVRLPVTVLVATGGDRAALAAKKATSSIPIVFSVGSDPVWLGLVTSYNRPGGNATGINIVTTTLEAKRIALLRELVPQTSTLGVLLNPDRPGVDRQIKDVQQAARALGVQVRILRASSDREIEAAFTTVAQERIAALAVGAAPFFDTRRNTIVALAAHRAVPTMYHFREFAEAGGLMSYGIDPADTSRQIGVYTGRILKGAKPADLPVMEPTKFELVINLKTAKALGLTIPPSLLARADQVIE